MRDFLNQKPSSHPFSDEEIIGLTRERNTKYIKKEVIMIATIITIAIAALTLWSPKQGNSYDQITDFAQAGDSVKLKSKLVAKQPMSVTLTRQNVKKAADSTNKTTTPVQKVLPKKSEETKIDNKKNKSTPPPKQEKQSNSVTRNETDYNVTFDFNNLRFAYEYEKTKAAAILDSLNDFGGDNYLMPFNGSYNVLPIIKLNKEELYSILPESFENGEFIIVRETLVDSDSIPEEYNQGYDKEYYIQSQIYRNGYFDNDTADIDWNNLKVMQEVNKRLYVSFTQTDAAFSQHLYSMNASPLIKMWDTYGKTLNEVDFVPDEYPEFSLKDAGHNKSILKNALAMNSKLKEEMIPVLYKISPELHYVLWFIPTQEFIERLPDRYRDEIRGQYELFRKLSIDNQEDVVETCLKLEGKKDYFGICGEKRGAIERIVFQSVTTDGISAELELSADRMVGITVSDLMGKVFWSETKLIKKGKSSIVIKPANLQKAPYFVVIETDEGEFAIEKVFLN